MLHERGISVLSYLCCRRHRGLVSRGLCGACRSTPSRSRLNRPMQTPCRPCMKAVSGVVHPLHSTWCGWYRRLRSGDKDFSFLCNDFRDKNNAPYRLTHTATTARMPVGPSSQPRALRNRSSQTPTRRTRLCDGRLDDAMRTRGLSEALVVPPSTDNTLL